MAVLPPKQAEQGAARLLRSWRDREPGQFDLDQYRALGQRASSVGESLLACDIADEGLKKAPQDRVLRQIKARALTRLGSSREANLILTELRKEASDEETVSLLAHTYKDQWIETDEPQDLERARAAYAKGYSELPDSEWLGVNTATLALASGDRATAQAIAGVVHAACLDKLNTGSGDEYWLPAMLGEACLILEDYEGAQRWYAEFGRVARGDIGNLSTTRRNARITLKLLPAELSSKIEQALQMPNIALFAGHRIDEPGRSQARFPSLIAPQVKEAIRTQLIELNAGVGYSSAASGSDILFLEAMQSIGGQTHVVLPCDEEQFLQESVASSGGDWAERFQAVIDAADGVHLASEQRLTFGSVAYDYSNELLHGLATVKADQLETELLRIAVWDGKPGLGPGGTAAIVRRWRAAKRPVRIIDPAQFLQPAPSTSQPQTTSARPSKQLPGFASKIRTMLFADAYHFSRLAEDQMPAFIGDFMGPVANLVDEMRPALLYQNTWGDGLFFVFAKVADAGHFALRLAECMTKIDRKTADLPHDMNLRIGLHVGPVYRFKDRITGRTNYIGSHVNRAARIEPITPPGKVYGSEAFAAFAAMEAPGEFRFDYVGRLPLAKEFGDYPMYHVQPALR